MRPTPAAVDRNADTHSAVNSRGQGCLTVTTLLRATSVIVVRPDSGTHVPGWPGANVGRSVPEVAPLSDCRQSGRAAPRRCRHPVEKRRSNPTVRRIWRVPRHAELAAGRHRAALGVSVRERNRRERVTHGRVARAPPVVGHDHIHISCARSSALVPRSCRCRRRARPLRRC